RVDVALLHCVLVRASPISGRGVDEQYLFLSLDWLLRPGDQQAHRDGGRVEQVWWQADDGLEPILLQQTTADRAFLAAAEQHAVGHDDAHPASARLHGRDHVLDPREVAGPRWGYTAERQGV